MYDIIVRKNNQIKPNITRGNYFVSICRYFSGRKQYINSIMKVHDDVYKEGTFCKDEFDLSIIQIFFVFLQQFRITNFVVSISKFKIRQLLRIGVYEVRFRYMIGLQKMFIAQKQLRLPQYKERHLKSIYDFDYQVLSTDHQIKSFPKRGIYKVSFLEIRVELYNNIYIYIFTKVDR